jgi:hypothetical protein
MASSLHFRVALTEPAHTRAREYRALYVLTLPLFLVAAALGRLSLRGGGRPAPSLLSEARANAHAIIPYAFMR